MATSVNQWRISLKNVCVFLSLKGLKNKISILFEYAMKYGILSRFYKSFIEFWEKINENLKLF